MDPKSLVAQREALERDIQAKVTALAEAEAAATAAAADDAAYRAVSEKVSALRTELRDQRERAERLDGIMADVAQGEQLRLVAEIETAVRGCNAPVNRESIRLQRDQEEARHAAAMERLAQLEASFIDFHVDHVPVDSYLARRQLSLQQIEDCREILRQVAGTREGKAIAALCDKAEQAVRRLKAAVALSAKRPVNAPMDEKLYRELEEAREAASRATEERDQYLSRASRLLHSLKPLLSAAARRPDDGPRGPVFGSPESDRLLRNLPNSGRATSE